MDMRVTTSEDVVDRIPDSDQFGVRQDGEVLLGGCGLRLGHACEHIGGSKVRNPQRNALKDCAGNRE